MKTSLTKVTISGLLCCASARGADGCCSTSASDSTQNNKTAAMKSSADHVSVYQVPWRCPAALQIGCGSHAKPILLELEKNPGVSEPWLNRQGTEVAVV